MGVESLQELVQLVLLEHLALLVQLAQLAHMEVMLVLVMAVTDMVPLKLIKDGLDKLLILTIDPIWFYPFLLLFMNYSQYQRVKLSKFLDSPNSIVNTIFQSL